VPLLPCRVPFSRRRTLARRNGRRRQEIENERRQLREQTEREIDARFAESGHRVAPGSAAGECLIYARYSMDFQHSVTDQVRACLDEAVRLNLFVPRDNVFYDLGVSGDKDRRAGLDRDRELLNQTGPKTLLVMTTNRLFRKMD
jgi:hypothetical protein